MTDRRSGDDRRGPGRPKGGRRATDPITDLATHHEPLVTVSQLAEYWGKHPYTLNGYIRRRKLLAALVGGEYRIRIEDALAFERRDPQWQPRSAQ